MGLARHLFRETLSLQCGRIVFRCSPSVIPPSWARSPLSFSFAFVSSPVSFALAASNRPPPAPPPGQSHRDTKRTTRGERRLAGGTSSGMASPTVPPANRRRRSRLGEESKGDARTTSHHSQAVPARSWVGSVSCRLAVRSSSLRIGQLPARTLAAPLRPPLLTDSNLNLTV